MGITGYDNLNKELVGIWIDSFGTGIMTSRGSCNDDWSVCKYEGEGPDPMSEYHLARWRLDSLDDGEESASQE